MAYHCLPRYCACSSADQAHDRPDGSGLYQPGRDDPPRGDRTMPAIRLTHPDQSGGVNSCQPHHGCRCAAPASAPDGGQKREEGDRDGLQSGHRAGRGGRRPYRRPGDRALRASGPSPRQRRDPLPGAAAHAGAQHPGSCSPRDEHLPPPLLDRRPGGLLEALPGRAGRPVPQRGLPVLLRSRRAAVTGDACPPLRSAWPPRLYRRGCPSHVAGTTWMWHPRRNGLDGGGTGRTGGAGVTQDRSGVCAAARSPRKPCGSGTIRAPRARD